MINVCTDRSEIRKAEFSSPEEVKNDLLDFYLFGRWDLMDGMLAGDSIVALVSVQRVEGLRN